MILKQEEVIGKLKRENEKLQQQVSEYGKSTTKIQEEFEEVTPLAGLEPLTHESNTLPLAGFEPLIHEPNALTDADPKQMLLELPDKKEDTAKDESNSKLSDYENPKCEENESNISETLKLSFTLLLLILTYIIFISKGFDIIVHTINIDTESLMFIKTVI